MKCVGVCYKLTPWPNITDDVNRESLFIYEHFREQVPSHVDYFICRYDHVWHDNRGITEQADVVNQVGT